MNVLQAWAAAFWDAWVATIGVMATILGVAAGIALSVLAVAILVAVLGRLLAGAFDRITDRMAKRWEKTGRRPRNRWAEIIARGRHREE